MKGTVIFFLFTIVSLTGLTAQNQISYNKQSTAVKQVEGQNVVVVAPVSATPYHGNIQPSAKSVVTNGTAPSSGNNVVVAPVSATPANQVVSTGVKSSVVVNNGTGVFTKSASSNSVEVPAVVVTKYNGQKSEKSVTKLEK